MRYWVYINDKVDGPYEEDKLVTVAGFTPDTLICAEEVEAGGGQEWVKAATVFEFDPVQNNAPQAAAQPQQSEQTAQEPAANVYALLLEKLDKLTQQMDSLQAKVDQVIAAGATAQARPAAQEEQNFVEDAPANTITLTQADVREPVVEEGIITNTESLMSQAETLVAQAQSDRQEPAAFPQEEALPKEGEEVVLRSALDSLYHGEIKEPEAQKESTFQELLTPKQADDLQNTLRQAKPQPQEPVKEITPAPADMEKDALLAELTAKPQQDNIIDQVIEEKQAEAAKQQEQTDAPAPEIPVLATAAAAAAGVAALNAQEEEKKEEKPEEAPAEKQSLDLTSDEQPQLNIAQTEEDAPAEEESKTARMTQVVAQELQYNNPNGLKSVEEADKQPTPAEQMQQAQAEATIQELVPGAKTEAPDNAPIITEADLREAFTEHAPQADMTIAQALDAQLPPQEQPQPAQEEQPASQQAQGPLPTAENNGNDLTEIELKEGSTYLISDFVPPAQTNGNELPKELNTLNGLPPAQNAQAAGVQTSSQTITEDIFEEVVPQQKAAAQQTEEQPQQSVPVPDVTLSKVILENTIKTKRGAALDIKTVPMVPEPAQSARLDLSDADLEDFNAQHDLKSADVKPAGKSAKTILGLLAVLLIVIGIYLMLAFMDLIPPQYNLLHSKTQNAAALEQDNRLNEMLGQDSAQTAPVPPAAPQAAADPKALVLEEVQNVVMANGMTLKDLIESRHPAMVNMIEWDATTAVEPDNYSILVKVPPENPQSFRTSYRFNYNTVTKELNPTISDAKNLLDSVGGSSAGQQLPPPPDASF